MLFGKLVRDKIPQHIREQGNIPSTHTASDEEFFNALINKIKEEANEVAAARDTKLEELADLLEAVSALQDFLHLDPEKVEKFRQEKKARNGEYKERTILDAVS